MKFKLDENFGSRTQQLFREAGHQVWTVREQSLSGASDQDLYQVCCTEQSCMVTLDLDFSDVLRFPPQRANGIVVIRVPKNPSFALLERLIRQFLKPSRKCPSRNGCGLWKLGAFDYTSKKRVNRGEP